MSIIWHQPKRCIAEQTNALSATIVFDVYKLTTIKARLKLVVKLIFNSF